MTQYTMFTQIVDDRTFVIGETTYSAGDKVALTPDEEATLARIRNLDKELRAKRQNLINRVHETDRTYLPDIVCDMHDLSVMGTEMRIAIPTFILDLNKRMGGRLPLDIDEVLSTITVRERRQGETLNYTVAAAMDLLMLTGIREQRELAILMAGDRKDTAIDCNLDRQIGLQPVTIRKTLAESDITNAAVKFLVKIPRPATVSFVVVTDTESHIFNPFEQRKDQRRQDPWQPVVDFAKSVKAKRLALLIQTGPTTGKPDHWNVALAYITKPDKIVKEMITFIMNPKGELEDTTHESKAEIKGVDLDALGRGL